MHTTTRSDAIDVVATTLPFRASRLLRLLAALGAREMSRTELGILASLQEGPRRITELAESEAVAQPTVTKLVDRLEQSGLVRRERSTSDRRVVLVTISELGRHKLGEARAHIHAVMRDTVEDLSNAELSGLVEATETLQRMIEALQSRRASL